MRVHAGARGAREHGEIKSVTQHHREGERGPSKVSVGRSHGVNYAILDFN